MALQRFVFRANDQDVGALNEEARRRSRWNWYLSLGAAALLLASELGATEVVEVPVRPPAPDVWGTFDVDDEGWRVVGSGLRDALPPVYARTGGLPGGRITADDPWSPGPGPGPSPVPPGSSPPPLRVGIALHAYATADEQLGAPFSSIQLSDSPGASGDEVELAVLSYSEGSIHDSKLKDVEGPWRQREGGRWNFDAEGRHFEALLEDRDEGPQTVPPEVADLNRRALRRTIRHHELEPHENAARAVAFVIHNAWIPPHTFEDALGAVAREACAARVQIYPIVVEGSHPHAVETARLLADRTGGQLVWASPGQILAAIVKAIELARPSARERADPWMWRAPEDVLARVRTAYGRLLAFDLEQSVPPDDTRQFEAPDVVLVGEDLTLDFRLRANPNTSWTHYFVPLMDRYPDWTVRGTDRPPTEAEFRRVLASLTDLRIRGEFATGVDAGSLDNVRLVPPRGEEERELDQ